jgi:Lipocalin-like domain
MNRRSIFSISAMTVLGLVLVTGSAVSQQKSLKDQLVGTWILVSTQTTTSSGTKYPYGTSPKGILMFDANGRYAAVQGRPDRPKLKSAVRLEATKEEFGAVAMEFAANFGTWSVDEADKVLLRRFEGALIPNNEGNNTRAFINLAGDDLRLAGELNSVTGERVDAVYRRVK